jgi:hypothetical protein
MRSITTQELMQVSGGANNDDAILAPFLCIYAGISAVTFATIFFAGAEFNLSALAAGFGIMPALGIGGSLIGMGAYLYGPQLWSNWRGKSISSV